MSEERRSDARVSHNWPARYDGLSGAHEARVEDISMGGCFINTPGQVSKGEIITIEIKEPSGEWLRVRGEVTTYQPGIGFGVVFNFLKDDEAAKLQQLIASSGK